MHTTRPLRLLTSCLCRWIIGLLAFSGMASAQIEITLNKSFIEKYKNRTTIDASFTIDKAHERPNAAKADGDLHVAGRAPEIRLATVAEIMNAAKAKEAVDLVHSVEGSGVQVPTTGVWRIWCEHANGDDQVQGKSLQPCENTNPDHVFEIHPVTKLKDLDLSASFVPIEGFEPKDADRAFERFEDRRFKIVPGRNTVKLVTTGVGYNYVEFIIELNENPSFEVRDGRIVQAAIYNLDEELLVRKRRMIFVKGTPPEEKVKSLKKGDRLHVLGVPRINLALVAWRIRNASGKPGVLEWNLPYEMVIVGVYPQ